jgi:hypothetical protein
VPAAAAAKDAPTGKDASAADPASLGRQAADLAQSLDQLLTDAMDRNPAIVTAKAKVALAQAELNAAQMEVSQHIISLWNEQKAQEKSLEVVSQKLQRIEGLVKSGAANAEESLRAESAVIEAQATLSKIQNELKTSVGKLPHTVRQASLSTPPTSGESPFRMPQGRLVASIRKALDQQVSAEFNETPIADVIDYLRDALCQRNPEFAISIDLSVVDDKVPNTLNLKGMPLNAILQAIEDQHADFSWQFVVRDYGLVLTDAGKAQSNGYLPMMDFMRLVTVEKDDLRQMLRRKADAKFDNVKIDELLASLLDPTGIQFDIEGNRTRKAMSNTTLDMKGAPIESILQALEDKNEGTQFVVKDDCIILTLRDYAQKRGWLPLTEFLRQSKPAEEKKGEESPSKGQPAVDSSAPRR